jgi:hypothetical protein
MRIDGLSTPLEPMAMRVPTRQRVRAASRSECRGVQGLPFSSMSYRLIRPAAVVPRPPVLARVQVFGSVAIPSGLSLAIVLDRGGMEIA